MRRTNDLDEWFASRPAIIRKLAEEFPPGSSFLIDGREMFLLGYGEAEAGKDCMLVISEIDPSVDYDAAVAIMEYIHPQHLRGE